MKNLLSLAAAFALTASAAAADKGEKPVTGPLEFTMKGIDGKEVDLAKYKGKVVLFVNVASKCGATPQYEGLQKLYDKYQKDGLVIIGVPANQFGKQEPGTNEQIAKFCESTYKVSFPMMAKVVVRGDGISPLYDYLTSKETDPQFGGPIAWNFEKFLISRDGKIVGRFKTPVKPEDEEFVKAIQTELEKK
jgi:glutathione peroxidase